METEQMNSGKIQLDAKDFQILKALQDNARLSVREVAAKVHLSPTPTHERIKRLEQQGVIKQYGALLDPRKVNKGIIVLCQVSVREHNKRAAQEFLEAVVSFREVIECYNIAGEFDFFLKIVTESMESYHSFFKNQLSEVPYIDRTKSIFVMDVIKQTHQLL